MVADFNERTRQWDSPVAGAPRLKPAKRSRRPGKGGDEVFELADGTKLSARVRARPRRADRPAAASTAIPAATTIDFVLQFALLDAEGRVERDAEGNPVLFMHHEVGQAPRLGAADLDDAIEAGWETYLAMMPQRIRNYRRAQELRALHGDVPDQEPS